MPSRTLLLLTCLLLPACAIKNRKQGGPKSPPFSDPVIIENPNVKIKSAAPSTGSAPFKHPDGNGRDWSLRRYLPFARIQYSIGGNPSKIPSLLNSSPVIVELDRLDNTSGRVNAASIIVSFRPTQNGEGTATFHTFAENLLGQNKFEWVLDTSSNDLAPNSTEQFRIRRVRFHDDKGQSKCYPEDCSTFSGGLEVKLYLCTRQQLNACN